MTSMNSRRSNARDLRSKLQDEKNRVQSMENQLREFERDCHHSWDDVRYVPIHTPGYQLPGDAPGTMGIDWRGPTWISATTKKRWSRECSLCGFVQFTEITVPKIMTGQIAGTSGTVDVPEFDSAWRG